MNRFFRTIGTVVYFGSNLTASYWIVPGLGD